MLLVEGPEAAASSLVAALRAVAPRGMTSSEVVQRARRGIEFMAAFSAAVMALSSTHRELYGLAMFILAAAVFLGKGRHQLIMDNLGCVFILGGHVPPFAVGGKRWGEFVSGGSPDPMLQRLALLILDTQHKHGFTLVPVWRPREENVRADYLSHVS